MPLRNFFNMDSGFFRVLSRVADLMILNIIFLICCIPIVTIGPALTAMHYVTLKMAVNEEGYIVRGFFKSFRQNLRQAMIIWVIMLVLGCILATDLVILRDATATVFLVMRIVILATFVVYLMVMIYVFPALARFDNTVRATMKNALFMAIIDFPRTIFMVVIIIAAVFLTFFNSYTFWYGLLVWIMLGFSTIAYVNSRFLAKIFKKYMPAEAEEEENDQPDELESDAISKLASDTAAASTAGEPILTENSADTAGEAADKTAETAEEN